MPLTAIFLLPVLQLITEAEATPTANNRTWIRKLEGC